MNTFIQKGCVDFIFFFKKLVVIILKISLEKNIFIKLFSLI